MEQTIPTTEFQELKEQFNLMCEKLGKQEIINKTLITESMKRKISYVDKVHKRYYITAILISPLMMAILLLYKAHWAFIMFVLLALGTEAFLHYRGFRLLNAAELMGMGLVDAVERVSLFKKYFNIVTRIMYIPALMIFVMFIGLMTNYTFHLGTMIYYGIFVLVAIIWDFVRKRKMFARLDEVLRQIKELREN